MKTYARREPQNEPELLAMARFYGHGATKCGLHDCEEFARYEAEFSDGSTAYYCADHGEEEAAYAQLEEV